MSVDKSNKVQRKTPRRFLRFLLTIGAFFTILGPLIGVVLVSLAVSLVHFPIVYVLAKLFRPDLKGVVTGSSRMFASRNIFNFPLNIVGIAVLNGHITAERVRQLMDERVLSVKKPDGSLVFHRLKRTWINFLGFAFWQECRNFCLTNHIRDYDYNFMSVPPAPSEADLQKIVGKAIKVPWMEGRSPWEIVLIHNYRGESKTIQMIRINHCLADGFSIYEMYKVLTRSDWRIPEFKMSESKISPWQRLALALKGPSLFFEKWVRYSNIATYKLPIQKKNKGRMELIFTMSPEVPVDVIKNIKTHFKVSYAAVCYAGICRTVARALEASGQKVPRKFCSTAVIPRPNHPGGLTVHADLSIVFLPLRSSSPEKLLRKINKILKNAIMSRTAESTHQLAQLGGIVPVNFSRVLPLVENTINKINVATANMPVTTGPDYFDGIEISELVTANSVIFDQGMIISLGGVNNKQRVSFCVNSCMFESEEIPRNLGIYFQEAIQEFLNAMV